MKSYANFDVEAFMKAASTDQENKLRHRKNDEIKNEFNDERDKENYRQIIYRVKQKLLSGCKDKNLESLW